MHDPEEFQRATYKAITDLQAELRMQRNRQMALVAMVRTLLELVPQADLDLALEAYQAAVNHQAEQMPPKLQPQEDWAGWQALIAARLSAAGQPQRKT